MKIYVTATATTKELLAQMRRNGVTAPYRILGYDQAKGAWLVELLGTGPFFPVLC